MSTTAISTLSPDTGLAPDISVSDLGKILGGGEVEAVKPEAGKGATPPVQASAAAAAEPPAAEPGKSNEAEAQTAAKNQETEKPDPEKPEPEAGKQDGSWVDKRMSQLAHKRRQAEAETREERDKRTAAEQKAEQLQRELDALKTAQPGPKQPAAAPPAAAAATGKNPQLADFVAALQDGEPYEVAVERYTAAVLEHRDQQKNADQLAQRQNEAKREQEQVFQNDWRQAMAAHPDFEDVVERVRAGAPDGLQVAISQLRQDDGTALWPAVTLYLDEHSDELAKLSTEFAQNPYAATARLGRIAARLAPGAGGDGSSPTPAASAGSPRQAPKPPAAVGGSAAPSVIDLEKADMNTFAREVGRLL